MPSEVVALPSPAPEISVVVPVYGCADCLKALHARLTATLEALVPRYEVVLVDDRAGDGSWEVIENLAAADKSVRGVLLSRNFGQHAAITAGLGYARGDWVVVMDCDLQDPPEDIPRLYAKALEGFDVVFGRRTEKPVGRIRKELAVIYFRALRVFTHNPVDAQYGTFSIISKRVVHSFLQLRDLDRHYLMVLNWLGYEAAFVDYEPARRFAGESSYSLGKLLEHAADGLFFQTTVLLRWIVYLGFSLATIGAGLALYLGVARVAGQVYPGWTSIIVVILVMCGFIILSTGITGLYIGKLFEQSRGRPIFVVDRVVEHEGTRDGEMIRETQPERMGW
jgi:glycosyltransferase involved in cell wall biosynthesis